jgi:excisionase family DNA binding protein
MPRQARRPNRLEEHLTPAEVAERLRLHPETVLRRVRAGGFPRAFFLGRVWRIPAGDVETWIAGHRPHSA